MMNGLQSVVIALSISYALIGALLLVVLAYARLPWTVKALAVVVISAFYIVSFNATRGLLGWASADSLPPAFKLLQARIVDPHSLEGDPGSIYLWVEALDGDNRPSGVPRAYRLPYSEKLAQRIDHAADQIAAGNPQQGGRAADIGTGEGGLIDGVREYILPKAVIETAGGDSSAGIFNAGPQAGDGISFTPLPPPRMPPKDQQEQ
jgi:hypothetical protein